MANRTGAEQVAETYYDSTDADTFYERVWGGEDIHIGLYEPDTSIFEASRKTVETMAQALQGLDAESRVLDLGAGYGGAARYLASTFGCQVSCLNLSETQNQRNRQLNREQNLDDRIRVVHGSFESIPEEAGQFDIIWSQDSFLHSGEKAGVLDEIARVIKPGGELIFTDPMQADDCPADVLQPVYDRLHLNSLASFDFYRRELAARGFGEIRSIPMVEQLRNHYDRVRTKLRADYDELVETISQEYIDRMLLGLDHWVDAADKGYLAWGILHFRKS